MTLGFSVFLDAVRFLAAVIVYLSHFGAQSISDSVFYVFGFYAHTAVIVFFVLSGYVIAYVAEHKERTVSAYTVARFCRIYSVVVPAVFITLAFDLTGRVITPELYAPYTYFENFSGPAQILSGLFFLQKTWWYNTGLFSNGPFWSLNCEVWYYVIFGIIFWSRSGLVKATLLASCVIVLGTEVLLLAPVWFFGVALRRIEKHCVWSKTASAMLFGACIVGLFAADSLERVGEIYPAVESLIVHLGGQVAVVPVRDYLTGLVVSMAFLSASSLLRDWKPRPGLVNPIRWCAGMTFSVYLFHRPFLLFLAAVLPGDIHGNPKRAAILAICTAGLILLSYGTERQKDRLKGAVLAIARHARGYAYAA